MIYDVLSNSVSHIHMDTMRLIETIEILSSKLYIRFDLRMQVLRPFFVLQITCFLVFYNQSIYTLYSIRSKLVQLRSFQPTHHFAFYFITGPDIVLDTLFPYYGLYFGFTHLPNYERTMRRLWSETSDIMAWFYPGSNLFLVKCQFYQVSHVYSFPP